LPVAVQGRADGSNPMTDLNIAGAINRTDGNHPVGRLFLVKVPL
jgi:hypothetical protein